MGDQPDKVQHRQAKVKTPFCFQAAERGFTGIA